VATWDPHTHPIVTEVAGFVRFSRLRRRHDGHRQTDEVTGLSSISVVVPISKRRGVPARNCARRSSCSTPRARNLSAGRTEMPAHYFLPPRASSTSGRCARVGVGDVIARIPQEASKTRDITGGLPRVADLFEARKPKDRRSWPRSPAPSASARRPRASAPDHHATEETRRWQREVRGADPEVAPAQRVRGRARGEGRGVSPTASRIRTTSCA
jgi:hypothetical protein